MGTSLGNRPSSIFGSGRAREEAVTASQKISTSMGRARGNQSSESSSMEILGPSEGLRPNTSLKIHNRSSQTSNMKSSSPPATSKPNAIRRAWRKVDLGSAEEETTTPMSQELNRLYESLSKIDVGMVHCSNGNDENFQYESLIQDIDENKSLWRDHDAWTPVEARLAGRILLRLEQEEVLGCGPPVKYSTYLNVINAYAKVVDVDEMAVYRAENLLDHMERRAANGRLDLKPDRLSTNTLAGAFAKKSARGDRADTGRDYSSVSGAKQSAERLLNQLEKDFAAGDETMRPTTKSYGKVIDAYARAGDASGALRTLRRQEKQYKGGNKAARPNVICYTSVIDSLAKSAGKNRHAAHEAQDLLIAMLARYDEGDSAFKPDVKVFSVAIDAWSKSHAREAPDRSLELLDLMNQYMVKPDIIVYNILINTLAHNSDNSYYRRKIDAILNSIESDPNLKADSFTYNAALKGMSPQDGERLLSHWEKLYKKGSVDERPDSFSYTAVMRAWANSNIRGFEDKVLEILDWMEENDVVGMNRIAYNEALRALSRSFNPRAGPKAEVVFEQLLNRYHSTGVKQDKPDKFTYFSIIKCWCRSAEHDKTAIKADDMLRRMVKDTSVPVPDNELFNHVLTAWARSENERAAQYCAMLLDLMTSLKLSPDAINYNAFISAHRTCAEGAGAKALAIFDRMLADGLRPNSVTYKILVQVCDQDEDREALIEMVFEQCCKEKMLDKQAYQEFYDKGSPRLRELLGPSYDDVPTEWRRNAHRGPATKSRNQIKGSIKRGNTGRGNVKSWGWAR